MRSFRALLVRFTSLFDRIRSDREFAAEMDSHLAHHVDDNIRAGMTPGEARRRAVLALGGVEQTKERWRERRGIPLVEGLWQDVRFGVRVLRKHPTFTVVAVATLALGLGITIAVFTVGNWLVLRPIPGVRDPGTVMMLMTGYPSPRGGITLAAVAIFLAAIGVYGIVAFGVAGRRREFGIRMALPATPSAVRRLVLERASWIAVPGAVLGFSGSVAGVLVVKSQLAGIESIHPLLWLAVGTALFATVFVASLIPAWRATRGNVAETLRTM